jgi:DNA-binding MarR family transcriptional regulator
MTRISWGDMSGELTDEEYQRLLRLRDGLRRFLDWSSREAMTAGLTPAQHQLLLAIRGHQPGTPSVRDVAEHLLTRHHSTVQLVDRAERAGLVERHADEDDHRVVRLTLTSLGARLLESLAASHLKELERLGEHLDLLALAAGNPEGT